MTAGTICHNLLHPKLHQLLAMVGRNTLTYRYCLAFVFLASCVVLLFSWYSSGVGPNSSYIAHVMFKQAYIVAPPNVFVQPLNVSVPWPIEASQLGWPSRIIEILDFKRGGFFVECFASDGETFSNTLMLERQYGWTGLLIEADPHQYQALVSKRRNVFLSRSCLSTEPDQYLNMDVLGSRTFKQVGWSDSKIKGAKCFHLHKFLEALKQRNVDYFSLDTGGGELDVLKTIPWNWINIRTLSVRVDADHASKKSLRSYMKDQGFYDYEHADVGANSASHIFVNAFIDSKIPDNR